MRNEFWGRGERRREKEAAHLLASGEKGKKGGQARRLPPFIGEKKGRRERLP